MDKTVKTNENKRPNFKTILNGPKIYYFDSFIQQESKMTQKSLYLIIMSDRPCL